MTGRYDYLAFALASLALFAIPRLWRKRRRRDWHSVFAPVPVATLVIILIGGWFAVEGAGARARDRVQAMVTGYAPTYAHMLQRMGHARVGLRTPPDDPAYLAMIRSEIEWQKVNPSIDDIYTMRRLPDGRIVFVVDAETDYDRNGKYEGDRESRTEIGEEMETPDPDLFRAFEGTPGFSPDITTDRWGSWVSAYAPMFDSSGRVEAVLGVDFAASRFVSARANARRQVIGYLAALVVLITVGTALIEALRASEERFRAMNESSPMGIFVTDSRGECRYANAAFQRIAGRTSDEIEGQSFIAVVHPDDVAGLAGAWQAHAVERGPFTTETRIRTPDGRDLWVSLHASRLTAGGRLSGYIATVEDITERKHAEAQLARYTRELEEAKRALEQQREGMRRSNEALQEARENAEAAVRAKSEFLANMSHEIRTPMNGVLGMTELLLTTGLSAHQLDYAQTIRSSGEALLAIINDILDLSKIEAGRMTIEPVPFDLQRALEDIEELLATRAEEKKLDLLLRYSPDAPTRVIGDPGRIRQIVMNLAGNAVKFTASGHVLIDVAVEERGAGDVLLRIAVEDSGIGISEEVQNQLFQKFSQADASTTRKFGGTGLGLAISRQLAEQMGGSIDVTSVPGEGSTFWLTLRLPVDGAEPVRAPAPATSLAGARVLIVDDQAVNRRILREQFTAWRMRPSESTGGADALSQLRRARAGGDPFAVAVVDLHMPEMDGEQLGRAISADPGLRDTRLVLLTSFGRQRDAGRYQAAGFLAYLLRPVRAAMLRDVLGALCAKSPEAARLGGMITRHSALEAEAKAAAPKPAPAAAPATRGSATRARILLAEDNIVNQKVAAKMLEKMGHQVDVASDGQAAAQMAESTAYDVILMDCQMPEVDGYEATAQIRAREAAEGGASTPIIAVTAHAMPGDRERCLAAGMDDYLSKPLNPDELVAVLGRWLRPVAAA
jgi:PAS domain S-box-containing protein